MAQVACGFDFTLCIGPGGEVYGFGNNYRQQLGQFSFTNVTTPKKIPGLDGISKVAAGPFHSVCLDYKGDVWTFGMKPFGRMGVHSSEPGIGPKIIESLHDIVDIACGRHTLCLDKDGYVWGFGLDDEHRSDYSQAPIKLPLENIRSIHAGNHLSICCDKENNLFIFETNKQTTSSITLTRETNPLKIPAFAELSQISAKNDHAMFLDTEGKVYELTNSYAIKEIEEHSPASGVCCGMIIDTEKTLWGSDDTKLVTDVEYLASSGRHTICKDSKNNVWVFGYNNHGQLADEENMNIQDPSLLPNEFAELFWINKSHAKSAMN